MVKNGNAVLMVWGDHEGGAGRHLSDSPHGLMDLVMESDHYGSQWAPSGL
jgi:hypothetical protein